MSYHRPIENETEEILPKPLRPIYAAATGLSLMCQAAWTCLSIRKRRKITNEINTSSSSKFNLYATTPIVIGFVSNFVLLGIAGYTLLWPHFIRKRSLATATKGEGVKESPSSGISRMSEALATNQLTDSPMDFVSHETESMQHIDTAVATPMIELYTSRPRTFVQVQTHPSAPLRLQHHPLQGCSQELDPNQKDQQTWIRSAVPTAHTVLGKEYSVLEEGTSQPYKGLEVSNDSQQRIALLENEVYHVRDLFRRYHIHRHPHRHRPSYNTTHSADTPVLFVNESISRADTGEIEEDSAVHDICNSPPIVDIVFAARYTKTSFLIYEMFGNRDFSGWNSSMRVCPWALIRDTLGCNFLNAISFLEREGKAHRYLAPSSILVSTNGSVKLSNFKYCIDVCKTTTQQTSTSSIGEQHHGGGPPNKTNNNESKCDHLTSNTPPLLPSPRQIPAADKLYLAPELFEGHVGDSKSDVYSIPMVLLYLLCGDLFEAAIPLLIETQQRRIELAEKENRKETAAPLPLIDPANLAEMLVWVTDVRVRSGISAVTTSAVMPFATAEALAIMTLVQLNQAKLSEERNSPDHSNSRIYSGEESSMVLQSRLPAGSQIPPLPPPELLPSAGDLWHNHRSKEWAIASMASRTLTPFAEGGYGTPTSPPAVITANNTTTASHSALRPNTVDPTTQQHQHNQPPYYYLPDGRTPLEPALCPYVPQYEVLADMCALLCHCLHRDPTLRPSVTEVTQRWSLIMKMSLLCH